MSFADLSARLLLNTSQFSAKLTEAGNQMKKFSEKAGDSYSKATQELRSHSLGLKDTARIIQGIMVSQAFYGIAQSIRTATGNLMEFNEQLDYAHVTYSALFGDTAKSANFVSALQEHSVNTIFEYQDLANAAKKMLAYGIEYENLMFAMEGLTNLGAMSGDKGAMDRIALAMGQIKTTGYLTGQEMRQLANAYVPIYDIIKEGFGLSGEDMERVGDLKLPAEEVLNAIVDYANGKFGEVGDAAMYTITGLKNRVVDTMKVMGTEMTKPLSVAWKSFLAYVADSLSDIRKLFSTGGWGAVFEHLVPDPDQQTIIRAFLANIHNMFMSIASVGATLASIFGNLGQTLMIAFNLIAPVVLGVVNVLSAALRAISENAAAAAVLRVALVAAAGAFALLRAHAVYSLVIVAVTKAVTNLGKALVILSGIISRHWLIFGLFAMGAALVGVSAASNNANNALSGLFKTLSGVGGATNQEDIFKNINKDVEELNAGAEEMNNRFGEGAESAEDMADGIGNAGKAAKKISGLLSFDEVFKLPDPSDSSSGGDHSYSGLFDDIGNLTDGFAGLAEGLVPEIQDFSEFIDGFTDGLFGGLERGIMERLKDATIGALLGAGIGAIIGGLLGGPGGAIIGAKIGALAGGIAGLLWDSLAGALSNTAVGFVAGAANAITSFLTKAGAAGFGTVVKNLIAQGSISGFFTGIANVLKNVGLKSILKGGVIGAAIGFVVDLVAHSLWEFLAERIEGTDVGAAKVAQVIGSVIGTVIGGIIGGPVGALIGSGVGTFVGGLIGLFKDKILEFFNSDSGIGATIGGALGSLIGGVVTVGNPLGMGIGALVGAIVGTIIGKFKDNILSAGADLLSIGGDIINGVLTGIDNVVSGIGTWIKDHIVDPFVNWFKDLFGIHSPSTVMQLFGQYIIDGLLLGMQLAWVPVLEWLGISYDDMFQWYEDIKLKTSTALDEIKQYWSSKWGELKSNVSIKWEEIRNSAKAWYDDLKLDVSNKLDEIKSEWIMKWAEVKVQFGMWWAKIKTSMDGWLEDYIWDPISDFFNITTFWERIKGLLEAIKRKLTNWWSGVTSVFTVDVEVPRTSNPQRGGTTMTGHATGGIFNREHIARFAEGNKAEAVIPLENASAMQPFVNAISQGILEGLAPVLVQTSSGGGSDLPPMYVGTLVADERGLKQLYKKFEVIQAQENARRGLVT